MGTYSKLLQDEQKNTATKSQTSINLPSQGREKAEEKSNRRSDEATIRRIDEPTQRPSDDPTKRRNDATQKQPTTRMAFDLPVDMSKAIRKEKAMREIQEGRAASLSEIAVEAFSQYFREASKRRSD